MPNSSPSPDAAHRQRPTADTLTAQDRARVAARYPAPRSNVGFIAVCVVLFAALMVWMVWAGLHRATPGISGELHGYRVLDDNRIEVTLDTHRRDPQTSGLCTVQAQAQSGEPVGELTLAFSPTGESDVRKTAVVRTSLRATTALLLNCKQV